MTHARITFHQHTPEYPRPLFTVVEKQTGRHWWHLKISDAIGGDRPEFITALPQKSKLRLPTPAEVALLGFRECNENCGHVLLTRHQDGIPVFSALWWRPAVVHDPICIWSSDPAAVAPIDPREIWSMARRALANHRRRRERAGAA